MYYSQLGPILDFPSVARTNMKRLWKLIPILHALVATSWQPKTVRSAL
jgi:hypothetical protein